MSVNGAVRALVLQPWLGEHLARQVSCLTGIGAILALAGIFTAKVVHAGSRRLLGVGLLWLLLTLAFELLVGHYVAGATWGALLADYDLSRGRLWPFVLLVTLCAPWLWGVLLRRQTS